MLLGVFRDSIAPNSSAKVLVPLAILEFQSGLWTRVIVLLILSERYQERLSSEIWDEAKIAVKKETFRENENISDEGEEKIIARHSSTTFFFLERNLLFAQHRKQTCAILKH